MEKFYFSEDDNIVLDKNWKVIENYKKHPYMLFYSLTNVFPMIKYEEELGHINDYIYHNNKNFNKILEEMNNKVDEAKNASPRGEYYGENIMFREADQATWEWLVEKVNKCSNIVLFLSFLEGALKEIYDWFSEEKNYKGCNKKREMSDIQYYIEEIGKCCNYDLYNNLEEELETIVTAKRIRNIFVHEWDAYYNKKSNIILDKELNNFKIIKLIDSISKILYLCEYAGLKGNILKKEDNDIRRCFTMERIERIKNEFECPKIMNIIDDYI